MTFVTIGGDMKLLMHTRLMSSWFMGLMAAFVLATFVQVASAAQSAGVLKTLTGTATVFRNGSQISASLGEQIYAGDRIATSSDSYVGITLHDDTLLTVGPRSDM